MEDAEVVATLALSLVPGIGSQRLRMLISTFGSAQAALAAPQSKLAALYGIGPAAATAIKEARADDGSRSEEHTSELQSPCNLVCRLLLEKKKKSCMQRTP